MLLFLLRTCVYCVMGATPIETIAMVTCQTNCMLQNSVISATGNFLCLKKWKEPSSQRGEICPAIEMHSNVKYVNMVYFIEKNRNFIHLVLNLCKLWVSKDDPLYVLR